jgi:prepilin-type N-terminal cleavage/methylation domain-containing protein
MSRNSRGDTIIEVMFAMAIIGVVLAAAYATASKNLQTSQLAKERTQATNIAEAQVEQLKSLGAGIVDTSFCLDITQANAVITTTAETPEARCIDGFYSKTITRAGNKYKVLVEWTPPGGSDSNKANVTIFYSDYDFALSGSSNVTIYTVTPSSGTTVVLGATIRNETSINRSGMVYSTSPNPELNAVGSEAINSDPTSDRYNITISDLDPAVVYYVRAFAVTPNGIIYSVPIPVNNAPIVPPIATAPVIKNLSASATASTATFSGSVEASGSAITRRVISYYRTSNPAVVWQATPVSDNFTTAVGSLLPGESYTYQLTVENSIGATTSSLRTFSTASVTSPSMTALGEFNGSTYYLSNDLVSWTEAKQRAEAMGGHLVTISSAAENTFVSSKFPQTSWIGLTDSRIEGVWEWVTREPFNYSSWSAGEPNNYQWTPAGQDYGLTNWAFGSGLWDDQSNDDLHRYVVEFDGVPRATSVLGVDYSDCIPSATGSPCVKTAGSVYGCANYNVRYTFSPSVSAGYDAVLLNYGDGSCASWAPVPPNNLYQYNINVFINGVLNVSNYRLRTDRTLATIPITPPPGPITSVNIQWTNNQWVTDDPSQPYKYDPDLQINNIALGYR